MASTPQQHEELTTVEVTGPADRKPYGWLILVQVIAYAVLVLLSLIPFGSGETANSVATTFMTTAVAALIVIEAFTCPYRVNASGRAIAVVAGFLALFCATTTFMGNVMNMRDANSHQSVILSQLPCSWAAGVGVLLIALIVVAFIRQMAREHRTNLIEHLSKDIAISVTCIMASGWCFLPMLLQNMGMAKQDGSTTLRIATLIIVLIVVVAAIALAAAAYIWHRSVSVPNQVHLPWLGMALLPVMLTGAIVGLGALGMVLLG
ncbi:hypothetical protein [Bifidobacterium gallicum]|uniref:Membrane protein n=1 Tax=Bifidobacterium gallicum DSM 20093 = LMG 11596 TaxID=561180 RepID=D1NWR6_9BIFI|nr:hypothetical protein [Bifidobacterium gallicum]EFA22225.1 hypothetical protein BIFGAL_04322 [Bifidobacterium gallicum DSM 20093 = LMG 11596]KFI59042.1 membrane protein [Bifidobacterium gallicum DSM 20093 = LMG 11596]